MTARRLIPATHVESWEADLRKAVHTAFDVQRASVHRSMAQQPSAPASLTAAGRRKKRAVPLAIGGAVWSDQAWTKLVNQHVAPVAKKVANDAMTVAKLSVAAALTWGVASSAAAVSAAIVSAAIASGVAIGKRLNDAFQTADDPDTAVGDVLDTAPDIMEDLVGAMATGAAESATYDVTSYVAGYFGNTYSGASRTWNAVMDSATREAHADADGQTVGLNDTFEVGGESLTGPGDPAGSDENTINCRCWTTTDGLDPASDDDQTGEAA